LRLGFSEANPKLLSTNRPCPEQRRRLDGASAPNWRAAHSDIYHLECRILEALPPRNIHKPISYETRLV